MTVDPYRQVTPESRIAGILLLTIIRDDHLMELTWMWGLPDLHPEYTSQDIIDLPTYIQRHLGHNTKRLLTDTGHTCQHSL